MKLQSFSIVFALIIIPILLVLTYYIQLQVDTITLQTEYDTKLLDATYDAMSSFEINTANENLSSVSDALRTIIDASNNVFFNTLSTNLGMSNASKSYIEPFVPAILYSLYDGYYIYAPTSVPEVLKNNKEVAITVGEYSYEDDGVDANDYQIIENKIGDDVYYKKENTTSADGYGLMYKDLSSKLDYGQVLYVAKDDDGNAMNNTYTTDPNNALLKTKNILKSYMPYSARYCSDDYDVTITYTLDNYVTIEGILKSNDKKMYYTKSGYIIDTTNLEILIGGDSNLINTYSDRSIQEFIENLESGQYVEIKIDGQDIIKLEGEINKKELAEVEIPFLTNQLENIQIKSSAEYENIKNSINDKYPDTIPDDITEMNALKAKITEECNNLLNEKQYELDKISATLYYCKSYVFTKWIMDNFGKGNDVPYQIQEKNLKSISGMENITAIQNNETSKTEGKGIYDFSKSDRCVFDFDGSNKNSIGATEISVDSPFYTHKLNVIRNSIQYNLNLAMTTYSKNSTFDYSMPIIDDSKWDDILSSPTIVSFMQGLNCGLKTYNNYMIVSSTNNEISVNPENIYYVSKDDFNDEKTDYHRIDCTNLAKKLGEATDSGDKEFISFMSKEIKYDKIYNKTKSTTHYWYDHKNLACYDCINDGNYEKIENGIFAKEGDDYKYPSLVKAFYIGTAKERYDLYKPNAVAKSQGYEVIYDTKAGIVDINNSSSLRLKDIDYIEIVFGKVSNLNETVLLSTDGFGNFNINSLNSNYHLNQTRLLYINSDIEDKLTINNLITRIKINDEAINQNIIEYVKVYYK